MPTRAALEIIRYQHESRASQQEHAEDWTASLIAAIDSWQVGVSSVKGSDTKYRDYSRLKTGGRVITAADGARQKYQVYSQDCNWLLLHREAK